MGVLSTRTLCVVLALVIGTNARTGSDLSDFPLHQITMDITPERQRREAVPGEQSLLLTTATEGLAIGPKNRVDSFLTLEKAGKGAWNRRIRKDGLHTEHILETQASRRKSRKAVQYYVYVQHTCQQEAWSKRWRDSSVIRRHG